MIDRRIQHKLGRQRQRVIKRLRRAKEIREAEDRKIAMRLEQANQVLLFHVFLFLFFRGRREEEVSGEGEV